MVDNRQQESSVLDRFTFFWLNPFIKKGWKSSLSKDDLLRVRVDGKSSTTAARFGQTWRKYRDEQTSEERQTSTRALYKTIYEFLPGSIALSAFLQLVFVLTYQAPPAILSILVELMEQRGGNSVVTDNYYVKGVAMCLGMFLCLFLNTLFANQAQWVLNKAGLQVRTGLMAAIYGKSFRLSGAARQQFSVGKAVQLMSADVLRVDTAWEYLHFTWAGPLQLSITFIMLYRLLGWSSFIGSVVLFVFIPIHAIIVYVLSKQRDRVSKVTERRIRLLQEIILGIKIIKYYAWEDVFARKMSELRHDELKGIRSMRTVSALSYTLTFSIPVFASIVSFLSYVRSGGNLTPGIVFPAMTYFNMLEQPLLIVPIMASYCIDAMAALKRIKRFLEAPVSQDTLAVEPNLAVAIDIERAGFEWEVARVKPPTQKVVPGLSMKEIAAQPSGAYSVRGMSASPALAASPFSGIHDLTLVIPRGSLVAIVGPVGSGKSSLLAAMMGEMTRTSGSIRLGGTIAYCPQQSWIQNATVKDNILFGRPFDQDRYDAVIEQCALTADLQLLSHGDMTEIGERGINLSGGQRLRVNLARAAYYDADILILDDPLSAVDAHVGRTIFEECICGGLMAGKTRILVTHHLHVLTQVDLILVMQSGQLVQRGTYDELFESETAFSELLKKYTSRDEEEGEEEEEEEDDEEYEEEDEEDAKKASSQVITRKEDGLATKGIVSARVYHVYVSAAGGVVLFVTVALLSMLMAEGCRIARDIWLAFWSAKTLKFNFTLNTYMAVYAAFGGAQAVLAWANSLVFVVAGYYAAKNLHEQALHRIMRAPLRFFDTTPVGRIISRFSKDQDILDSLISEELNWLLYAFGYILSSVVEVAFTSIWNLCFLVPAFAVGFVLQSIFRTTSRQLQRLQAQCFSPLMSNFSETFSGMSVIKAFRVESIFIARHHDIVDYINRSSLLNLALQRWTSTRSGVMGSFLVIVVSLYCFLADIEPEMAGLGILSALDINTALDWCIKQFAETEASMIAVERINFYAAHLESEAAFTVDANKPKAEWPDQGRIEFKDVYLSYRPSLPPVLSGISVAIEPRQKVAIVGRTGAGKSTILLALFRVIELSSGQILIDGVDISKIGLKDLRSRLAIVPQEPVLFSGTLRFNLDPRGAHTDAEIWLALERTYMREHVAKQEGGLDSAVLLNGENYSVGQRQLLCLTRALLRQSKIIVMDEATASIDLQTDALIQTSLRLNFAAFTLITIAHRINTILDYDRILVLDGGRVVEFGEPQELLADENSAFASLAAETHA